MRNKKLWISPPEQSLYTTQKNYINIAETIDEGKMTLNLIEDMKKILSYS